MACIDVWKVARVPGGTPHRREENVRKNAFNQRTFNRNLQVIVRLGCSVNVIPKFEWKATLLRLILIDVAAAAKG